MDGFSLCSCTKILLFFDVPSIPTHFFSRFLSIYEDVMCKFLTVFGLDFSIALLHSAL